MKNLDLYSKLANYGLVRDEATVYIELSRLGTLRVSDIVKATDLPRSSIYEHLHDLQQKGLVQQNIRESFKLYTALPFSSMRNRLDEDMQRLQSLSTEINTVAEELTGQLKSTSDNIEIRYFKGTSGARQLLWNTLKSKESVCVYSSWGRSQFVGEAFYKRFVQKSEELGVKEQVIINGNIELFKIIIEQAQDSTSRTNINSIKTIDKKLTNIKGETFIYDDVFAQLYLRGQVISGFEVRGLEFSELQKSLFETAWKTAKSIC